MLVCHVGNRDARRRVGMVITLVAAIALMGIVSPSPAEASGACGDRSMNSIKRYYPTKAGRVPLRCGFHNHTKNKGFGVRHLEARGRYNIWYQGMIGATLASPASIKSDGTTFVYRTEYFTDCDPVYRFKVIVQTKNVGGTRLMRGVITAYKEKRV